MPNTHPKVSIIVPVHNAGNRLKKCLQTLVEQTLRDIEIILVIDCPTDGSEILCREFAAKDSRIVLVENKENLHIGLSRNTGLAAARGEYIGFSDHDDFRELNMYETLYNQAVAEDSDIVLGVSVAIGEQNEILKFSNLAKNEIKDFALRDLLRNGDDATFTPLALNIHPNIYRSNLLITNKIAFADTREITPEDRIFQIMSLANTEKVSVNNTPLYFHVVHNKSAGHTSSYTNYKERANGKMLIFNFLNEKEIYQTYEKDFLVGVKKEFTDKIADEFYHSRKFCNAWKLMKFFSEFAFCKKAFRTAKYSLKRYRLGGKLVRKLIFLTMRFV